MGWSYGVLPDGREVGYGVHAVCEHPGCAKHIDRGLAHLCGAITMTWIVGRLVQALEAAR